MFSRHAVRRPRKLTIAFALLQARLAQRQDDEHGIKPGMNASDEQATIKASFAMP
jgi:hypothetical protein